MSILIVGGAGYIGSHTAKLVAASGHRPVVFDNLVYGHRSAVKWGPLVEGDLADPAAIRRALSEHAVEAVIHFAAYAYVGESMTDPGKYFRNNVAGTINLLDAMVAAGVRDLVFSSTCATYGEPREVPISESHPQNPVNAYGETKLAVERMLRWYGQAHGLRYAARTIPPRRTSSRWRSRRRMVAANRSRSSEPTTRPPTALRCGTTFTSSIWARRTCWPWPRSPKQRRQRARPEWRRPPAST